MQSLFHPNYQTISLYLNAFVILFMRITPNLRLCCCSIPYSCNAYGSFSNVQLVNNSHAWHMAFDERFSEITISPSSLIENIFAFSLASQLIFWYLTCHFVELNEPVHTANCFLANVKKKNPTIHVNSLFFCHNYVNINGLFGEMKRIAFETLYVNPLGSSFIQIPAHREKLRL